MSFSVVYVKMVWKFVWDNIMQTTRLRIGVSSDKICLIRLTTTNATLARDILIVALLAFIGASNLAAQAPISPEELFLPSEAFFRSLGTIQFDYISSSVSEKEDGGQSAGKANLSFKYNAPCFISQENACSEGTVWKTNTIIHAFNGETYQHLDEAGIIRRSNDIRKFKPFPYISILPIIAPYVFAYDSEPSLYTLDSLADPRLWKNLAKNTKVIGHGKIQTFETTVVAVRHPDAPKDMVCEVQLATELNWYPLMWSTKRGNSTLSTMQVTKHALKTTQNGKVCVPLVVEIKGFSETGKQRSSWTMEINEETFICGKEIPKELFTISSTAADSTWDADLNVPLKIKEEKGAKGTHPLPDK